jgi:hypothetical protein
MNQFIGADRISKEFAAKVIKLHDDGKSPNAISSILKTSTDKVRLVLQDNKLKPNPVEPTHDECLHKMRVRDTIERHQALIRERELYGEI